MFLPALACLLPLLTVSSQTALAETAPIDACYESWEPYYAPDKSGNPRGPVISLLREIARE